MKPVVELSPNTAAMQPNARTVAHLSRAAKLRREGEWEAAIAELEATISEATTATTNEIQQRVMLAVALSDLYVARGRTDDARVLLANEEAHAAQLLQSTQATDAPAEKRLLQNLRTQLRDRHTQVSLVGRAAPEISIARWLSGEPTSLATQRGRVVLLEFWATWCRPCQAMFPKLKALHDEHHERGLSILALTRFYMAYGGSAEAQASEIEIMRAAVRAADLEFPAGVAEDERTQNLYGATALPTLALIDRRGTVRCYGHFAGETGDAAFDETLQACLNESV